MIDFKTEYTHSNITKEFFLENRGWKAQKIVWTWQNKPGDWKNKKEDTKKEEDKKEEKKEEWKDLSMISEQKEKEKSDEDLKFVFAVVPDTVVLQPKMGIYIQFRANSFQVGWMVEMFVCNSTVAGEWKPRLVYNTTLQGDFIGP